MFRASATVSLRSLSDFFRSSFLPHHVPSIAAKKFVFYRTSTAATEAASTTEFIQLQIVDALRFGERSKASTLLLSLVRENHSLKANDFLGILTYCARSPDPLFVIETWKVMEELQISPDSVSSILVMRALCKQGYLDEAFEFMNLLEEKGFSLSLPFYNIYLGACIEKQSADRVNQCLELMDSRMMGLSDVTYRVLLKLVVQQKNLSAAHGLWNQYTEKYSISLIFLNRFICSFAWLGDLKSAFEGLQLMTVLALRDSHSTFFFKNKEGRLSSKLEIPIPLKNDMGLKQFASLEGQGTVSSIMDKIPQHSEEKESFNVVISKPVMKLLRWSFDDVIHACARLKDYGLAQQLMAQMQKFGILPSSYTCDGYVKAVIPQTPFGSATEVLILMKQRNMIALSTTLAVLSVDCSKALKLDLAESYLQKISSYRDPHPFNMFFAACDTLDKPEYAARALKKMRKLNILPNVKTYELLFSLFGTVNSPYQKTSKLSRVRALNRITAIEMDMQKNGVQHSHLSMKILLKALGKERMIRTMLLYLGNAEILFRRTNTYLGLPIYNTVLHALFKAKKVNMARKIFRNMRLSGVSLDEATYETMINICAVRRSFRSASALVSLMYRDGFYPRTSPFTALLKILLDQKRVDEALDIFDIARSQRIPFNHVLFNTMLFQASKRGLLKVVEFVVERMHQEKVKPDSSTCNHVFNAYIWSGLPKTAMEALQVVSLRMLCVEYGSLSEEDLGIIRDELILSGDDAEIETRLAQLFQNNEGNLVVALLNLRWSAILDFPIPWSPRQSNWARRLEATYGPCDSRPVFS